jgi:hypothetical protein
MPNSSQNSLFSGSARQLPIQGNNGPWHPFACSWKALFLAALKKPKKEDFLWIVHY